MITNDVLRRVRYALQLNDTKMLAIFASVDNEMNEDFLHSIMAKEEAEGLYSVVIAYFRYFLTV